MDAITLTRQLIDIESISGNEAAVGNYLYGELCRIGYQTRRMPVEGDRFNVYATSAEQPNPEVVFSTHMDTVPPFIPSSEDAVRIYGRGSCDAKGIIAAQIAAAERLRRENVYVGLLFVVGEERDSLGAQAANEYAASQPAHACKLRLPDAWRIRLILSLANPPSTSFLPLSRGCVRCRCRPIRKLVLAR
jgi:acetylornithine deacetylase